MATMLRSASAATARPAAASSARPGLAFGLARPAARPLSLQQRSVEARIFGGGDDQQEGDKKFLSRDEEPEEYWSSKSERAGNNPLSDPLAVIGILAIFFPFILLLVAGATGFIDFSVYKG